MCTSLFFLYSFLFLSSFIFSFISLSFSLSFHFSLSNISYISSLLSLSSVFPVFYFSLVFHHFLVSHWPLTALHSAVNFTFTIRCSVPVNAPSKDKNAHKINTGVKDGNGGSEKDEKREGEGEREREWEEMVSFPIEDVQVRLISSDVVCSLSLFSHSFLRYFSLSPFSLSLSSPDFHSNSLTFYPPIERGAANLPHRFQSTRPQQLYIQNSEPPSPFVTQYHTSVTHTSFRRKLHARRFP